MTTSTDQIEKTWTLKEAIGILRISERTMHNLLNSGKIEGMFDGRWKFTDKALKDYKVSITPKEGKGAKRKRAYHRKQQPST